MMLHINSKAQQNKEAMDMDLLDGYTQTELMHDLSFEAAQRECDQEAKELESKLDSVMTNEELVMEIISNNQDCFDALMEMMSIQTPDTFPHLMTLDKLQQLARSAVKLIEAVETHAKGYVK